MTVKIIVIGAGQGGMQCAKILAKAGHGVVIFEKDSRENHCHDQIDVVETSLFTDLDVPLPEGTVKSTVPTFVSPSCESSLTVDMPEEARTWNIERKAFGILQVEECEKAGVEIRFDTPVDRLIFTGDRVKGIVVNGEDIYADLVIDSSGMDSPFRKSFKGKFGITEEPLPHEKFETRHAYYTPAEGVIPGKYCYYLNYCGLPGICWCGLETDGTVSTLIGKIGGFTDEECENAFNQLKYDNPLIGDTLLRGGHRIYIPVRYPAPIMTAPGYASVGDCAFMTVPLMGNGIANAVRAGQMLADAIIENGSVNIDTLWKYNVTYYKKIGAMCCLIDFVKRALLAADNDEISALMNSGLIKDEEIAAIMYGNIPRLEPDEIIAKIRALVASRKLMGLALEYLLKGVEAFVIGSNAIPRDYGPAIYEWKYKLERLFNK